MNKLLFCLVLCLFTNVINGAPLSGNENIHFQTEDSFSFVERKAQAAFKYFLDEVQKDITLTHEEQDDKIQEFKIFADNLSPEVASHLTSLLIEETRSRIIDMLQNAELDSTEIDGFVAGYEEAILRVQNMNVEIAREMLFFVAELKIHRQYVYDFGIALGSPAKQLLRHDLCKLDVEQFEGYARYFRGGRQEEDKLAYLAAWEHHQYEEHHHQSYSKEGFNFEGFSEERIRDNMFETVADLLAATKQRGGGTMINYLVNIFPKQNPHPRLLPYLEEGLKMAHAFHLDSVENPNSEYKLFQGLPSWNHDVEDVFIKLKEKTSTKSYFVGELGTAWQFPSDHLPVGASIDNIHFALWNTLNTEYLHWIEKNGQGLRDSLILNTNVPLLENSILTVRED